MSRQDLIRNVIERPDDAAARRSLSQWLLERGDPWGELIDVQLQLSGRLSNARRRQLRERADAITSAHGSRLAGPVHGVAASYRFRGGFVEEVSCDGAAFMAHVDVIRSHTPIRYLELHGLDDDSLERLTDSPVLASVRNLRCVGGLVTARSLTRLAESPHARGLAWLNLRQCQIDDAAAIALSRSPHLALQGLSLNANTIGDEGAAAIAAARITAPCKALYLSRNEIGDAGACALLDSKSMPALERLGLGGNEAIGAATIAHVSGPSYAPAFTLRYLELDGTGVAWTDLRRLQQSADPALRVRG
jgi:Leucine Rich repeat